MAMTKTLPYIVCIKLLFYDTYINLIFDIDELGHTNKAFAISGCNDTEAKACQTGLVTPGFTGNEHTYECLSFFYDIKVRVERFFICNLLTELD